MGERNGCRQSWQQHLSDAAATRQLGCELAPMLLSQGPRLLLLHGDLGAGKTCLVQGLALALGINEPITSPTFALAQHYSGQRNGHDTALVHLDLYRLEQPEAAEELFAQEEEEALAQEAVLAVEWPERLSVTPDPAWQVHLLIDADGRLARVQAPGEPEAIASRNAST
ncbi:tRNA (adenosine(37)-N6)-threonylcarbamoyltransferase complex ATPase subunit type 1 TsaE [Synechococcus sp. BA-124 BA4]|uniref:tRNA (adenosine(37)-N6)-threonylcarbamoyltransferase complex ATPase subunit type 1 TsaE n=1 Tax=unclassified Synechococcus TaxID=2626047 RepID=UPI002AD27F96|nr:MULTISPECIES: tRNA (adenosine(37)-N6)-threonylcarbamoyltransferase complex ATPase subunit type 1 TsaE [unclassified Synechococcus]MEA5400115.1 tRNA (adenosine(37)-N6)-threonylcarbamoyltransferase complex ATPase subunit type 1 TsaE [Synechococcus sp. BA-124 BA4]CAK6688377.1 tRNA threonylcarbamoyladenosine biosynthesis protein TsaE [Synechococcus sp. CBW1107]